MEIKLQPEVLLNLSSHKMLGQHTTRILFYMLGIMGTDNVAKISQQKLAERIGTSGQTVYASTKWLCQSGFIAKLPDGKRQKSFIVSPALAIHDGADYEAIMDAFTEAQSSATVTVEEGDSEPFVGIPEE